MSPSTKLLAGVELGGTKCVCILGTGPDDVRAIERLPTGEREETLRQIEAVLDRWRSQYGAPRALGIASFGPVDLDRASPTYGFVTTTPKPGWRDTDLARRFERRFGIPTGFDTDVNGAALAEGRWGGAVGLDDYAYITVGTGIGVGSIIRGRSIFGICHTELGHIRVVRKAGDTFAGSCQYHGDCVEGLCAGPAIEARVGLPAIEIAAGPRRVGVRRAWPRAAHAHDGADDVAEAHLPGWRSTRSPGALVRAHPAGAQAQPQRLRGGAGARPGARAIHRSAGSRHDGGTARRARARGRRGERRGEAEVAGRHRVAMRDGGKQMSLSGTNLERAGDHNQRVTLHAIRVNGPITRTELAEITGLTAPAIANITKRLLVDKLIQEAGRRRGGRGQPATKLVINPDSWFSIGLNVDRDHITMVLLDFEGRVRARASREVAFALPKDVEQFFRKGVGKLLAKEGIGAGPARRHRRGVARRHAARGDVAEPAGQLRHLGVDRRAVIAGIGARRAGVRRERRGRRDDGRDAVRLRQETPDLLLHPDHGRARRQPGHRRQPFPRRHGRSGELGMLRVRDPTGHERQIQNIVSLSALYSRLAAQGIRVSEPKELTELDESGQAIIDAWVEAAVDTLIDPIIAINCLVNPEAVLIGGRLPSRHRRPDRRATQSTARGACGHRARDRAGVARRAVRRRARGRRRDPAVQPPLASDTHRAHEDRGAVDSRQLLRGTR